MRSRAKITERLLSADHFLWIMGLLLLSALPLHSHAQEPRYGRPMVHIRTTAGNMVVALYNETPLHRDNFLAKVRAGMYDSTLFHRMVKDFMVQGGDTASRRAEDRNVLLGRSPAGTVPAEIVPGLIHLHGALAAARQDDKVNPERASSDAQFYFVLGARWNPAELEHFAQKRNERYPNDTLHYSEEQLKAYARNGGAPHLDGRYTVFGEIVQGLEVLDIINQLACDGFDRPEADVRIWMTVLE